MERMIIGVAAPLTGLSATLGYEMKQAIELAIDEKNSTGGISGFPIELLAVDDQSKVEKAENAARKLCSKEQLVGVIGHYGSDTSLAAAKIYHENQVACVLPIASNPVLTSSGLPNVFRYTNRDDKTALAISRYLFEKLGKRAAVVVKSATTYGNSMAEEFKNNFTNSGGLILNTFTVREGEQNFNLVISQLPSGFDLVFYGGTFEGVGLLKALRASGHHQLLATGDGCWDIINFLEPAGDDAETGEGVLVLSASSAVGDVPGSFEFKEKYERKYGRMINYALNSYDAACLLMAAIETVGTRHHELPTRQQVLKAIKTTSFRGLANANPLIWDINGDNRGAITKLNIIKNGEFSEVAHINRANDSCP